MYYVSQEGGGGIPIASSWRWHPHFSFEGVSGSIPIPLKRVDVAFPLLLRRCVWHPHIPSEGVCGIPTSLKKMEVASLLLFSMWWGVVGGGGIPISLKKVEVAPTLLFRLWRRHQQLIYEGRDAHHSLPSALHFPLCTLHSPLGTPRDMNFR